ncbi:MAG: hypothetical protein ACYDEY_15530 [Acidimicrobiales bacterium]
MPELRFEGTSLAPLLEKIRTDLGEGCSITRAVKKRKGGIWGFYAREYFEITVAKDDLARDGMLGESIPSGVPEGNEADSETAPEVASRGPILAEHVPHVPEKGLTGTQSSVLPGSGPLGSIYCSPGASTAAAVGGAPEGTSSPSGHSLAARTWSPNGHRGSYLARDVEDDSNIVAGTPEALGDYLGVPLDQGDPATSPFADMLDAFTARALDGGDGLATEMRDGSDPQLRSKAPVLGGGVQMSAGLAASDVSAELEALGLLEPVSSWPASEVAWLVSDGQLGLTEVHDLLLARLPDLLSDSVQFAPTPLSPGSLLVIAGDLPQARRAAEEVARDVGSRPDEVLVATRDSSRASDVYAWLVVASEEAVAQRRRRWRNSSGVVILALDAPITEIERAWAKGLIAMSEPTAVWGVADATRKASDVLSWSQDLGGFDALAISDSTSSRSPFSVLSTGIPLARLDGALAGPDSLASVIASRVNDAARKAIVGDATNRVARVAT